MSPRVGAAASDRSETPVPLGSLRDAPNAITAARLAVTVASLVCLSWGAYRAALATFLAAAATDWADGFWARRWGPITRLGRVLDPLADKLLICGVFTYLAAEPASRVAPWMAVVVLFRELLVTTLRGLVEGEGGDFSAVWIGKWKFVAQTTAAGVCLLLLTPWGASLRASPLAVDGCLWVMLALTALSGVAYTRAAIRTTRTRQKA